jgi:hypothetical protein
MNKAMRRSYSWYTYTTGTLRLEHASNHVWIEPQCFSPLRHDKLCIKEIPHSVARTWTRDMCLNQRSLSYPAIAIELLLCARIILRSRFSTVTWEFTALSNYRGLGPAKFAHRGLKSLAGSNRSSPNWSCFAGEAIIIENMCSATCPASYDSVKLRCGSAYDIQNSLRTTE